MLGAFRGVDISIVSHCADINLHSFKNFQNQLGDAGGIASGTSRHSIAQIAIQNSTHGSFDLSCLQN